MKVDTGTETHSFKRFILNFPLMLGGKVKITLPSGKEGMLTISPNTRVGDRRRMSGAGIDGGDLDLEFVMAEVDDLTKEQKAALEQLRKTGL